MRALLLIFSALALAGAYSGGPPRRVPAQGYRDWRVYGGSSDGTRYSALDQINRQNVTRLEPAWVYDTGDAFASSEMQCNPIVVDGVLFATTPKLRVIALDAATGALRWSFDPHEGRRVVSKFRNRGVTFWESGDDRRILFVARHYLYALDARTGAPVASFGNRGRVDLREGLGRPPAGITISASTPGAIYKDLLILGSLCNEGLPAAPGDIRAYDVRTGRLRWSFHTIPHPGEFGYNTWPKEGWKYLGAANSWGGLSVDQEKGLVFVPTGSAAFDFFGANRVGDNLFSDSLLALRAETGERVWHFQVVRHDVWDRDLPAQPNLVRLRSGGRWVDAVAQITKSGHVFVFERGSGKPVFPIEHRRVPRSDVEGEVLADTQPIPVRPPPFARQVLTEDMLTQRTPEAHAAVLARFKTLRSNGQFAPPSLQGTIVFPGFDGGGEWGSAAFDPETGLYYINSNEMANILRLVERPRAAASASGRELYQRHCASCHGADRKGNPPEFPDLTGVGDRYLIWEIQQLTMEGSGRMPGFAHLRGPAVRAIVDFVVTGSDGVAATEASAPSPMELPYSLDGYRKFLDPDGYPAVAPPWGTLNAFDLDRGELVWKIPFGEFPELAAKGLRNTGTENYGGPVVTAGGLLFIGATNHDRKFHAFDKRTGALLWEATLPAAGNATPATYMAGGRQFVVIAAGGGKSGAASSGGSYVAFALRADAARAAVP
jgi:quinoprotein glucose dehydrogenase